MLDKEQEKIKEPGGVGWIKVLHREVRCRVSSGKREHTQSDKDLCGSKYGLHPWVDRIRESSLIFEARFAVRESVLVLVGRQYSIVSCHPISVRTKKRKTRGGEEEGER